MTSLPPALNFADAEEKICETWTEEDTFKTQDKLSLERGDDVSAGHVNCFSLRSFVFHTTQCACLLILLFFK